MDLVPLYFIRFTTDPAAWALHVDQHPTPSSQTFVWVYRGYDSDRAVPFNPGLFVPDGLLEACREVAEQWWDAATPERRDLEADLGCTGPLELAENMAAAWSAGIEASVSEAFTASEAQTLLPIFEEKAWAQRVKMIRLDPVEPWYVGEFRGLFVDSELTASFLAHHDFTQDADVRSQLPIPVWGFVCRPGWGEAEPRVWEYLGLGTGMFASAWSAMRGGVFE